MSCQMPKEQRKEQYTLPNSIVTINSNIKGSALPTNKAIRAGPNWNFSTIGEKGSFPAEKEMNERVITIKKRDAMSILAVLAVFIFLYYKFWSKVNYYFHMLKIKSTFALVRSSGSIFVGKQLTYFN
jgi:hypothetical protein